MNIDQYRAMVEAEKAQADSNKEEQPVDANKDNEQPPETKTQEQNEANQGSGASSEAKTEEKPASSEVPDTVTIDGEAYTLDQIKEMKLGNMRTADYTKKTQELAAQRKELKQAEEVFNFLRANPHILEQMAQVAPNAPVKGLTPEAQRVAQVEQQMADIMLERDIARLQAQYPDFNVVDVLTVADQKQITNLEDAYFIARGSKGSVTPPVTQEKKEEKKDAPLDLEAIKAQVKADLLKELETERNTSSIISSQGSAPTNNETPTLSAQEDRVRQMQGLSVEEYLKWRGHKSSK